MTWCAEREERQSPVMSCHAPDQFGLAPEQVQPDHDHIGALAIE